MDVAATTSRKTADDVGFVTALRRIYRLMSPPRRRQLWLVIALTFVGGFAELCTIGAIIPFLTLLAHGGEASIGGFGPVFAYLSSLGLDSIAAAAGFFVGVALVAGALRLALAWVSQVFVGNLSHEITTEIQRRVLLQPYTYHLANSSSVAVASLEQVHQLAYGVIQQLVQCLAAAGIGAFVIVGMAAVDARTAAAAAIAFGLVYAVIILAFRRRLQARSKTIAAAYAERVKLVQESIGGIRDVIIDHAQDAHLAAFARTDRKLNRAIMETTVASVAPRFLLESAGIAIIALAALALSRSPGGLPAALPVLGALALGGQRLLPLMNQLYHGWSIATANKALAAQVSSLLELPTPTEQDGAAPIRPSRSIEFQAVSFSYEGRSRPAIDHVDLVIPRGATLAIMGRTGSGKSTLADLLMGLLQPTQGRILVDGRLLDRGSIRSLQATTAHVSQAIFLIDASIARNIALSAPHLPIDLARVTEAAAIAQLTDFIATLPEGLDTIVGERGVRLSGGQRQRLGIARALYKQAALLVLDEATSALDDETEAAFLAALTKARKDQTIIVIAHRRSTIERCDLRVRLDRGRIVEQSTV